MYDHLSPFAYELNLFILMEGNLEVKLPTLWTDEKQRRKSEEKVKNKKRTEEQVRESQKNEDAGAQRVGKSRKTVCRKVRSLKRRVRSQRLAG